MAATLTQDEAITMLMNTLGRHVVDGQNGEMVSTPQSRFGGVFVEVAAQASASELHNSYCNCKECSNHATREEKRAVVLTYAMSDLVLA
jgi:hypothetical protein